MTNDKPRTALLRPGRGRLLTPLLDHCNGEVAQAARCVVLGLHSSQFFADATLKKVF